MLQRSKKVLKGIAEKDAKNLLLGRFQKRSRAQKKGFSFIELIPLQKQSRFQHLFG